MRSSHFGIAALPSVSASLVLSPTSVRRGARLSGLARTCRWVEGFAAALLLIDAPGRRTAKGRVLVLPLRDWSAAMRHEAEIEVSMFR